MTVITSGKTRAIRELQGTVRSVILLSAVVLFALFVSETISDSVIRGMKFAVFTVLPTSYPFMIIGDLYVSVGAPEKIWPLKRIMTRLLGVSEMGLSTFICGTVAGFPLGAKIASELYTGGYITQKEAEKLAAISNNPSIPFITAAVGEKVYGNAKIGLFLLIVIYISTLISANLWNTRHKHSLTNEKAPKIHFSFTSSVRNAALASINIIAFVTVFFAITAIISLFIKNPVILSLISALLEVTTAVNYASLLPFPLAVKLVITAFALGFGGLSVMMQSGIFTKSAGLSLKTYFFIKLTEGVISALLCAFSIFLFPEFFK